MKTENKIFIGSIILAMMALIGYHVSMSVPSISSDMPVAESRKVERSNTESEVQHSEPKVVVFHDKGARFDFVKPSKTSVAPVVPPNPYLTTNN